MEFYCRETLYGRTVHYCYLVYGGYRCTVGEQIEVPSGKSVTAKFGVRANGFVGKVAVQVWDWNKGETLAWKEHEFLKPTDVWFDEASFKVVAEYPEMWIPGAPLVRNYKISYILYKLEGGKWKQVDDYGYFYVKAISKEELGPMFKVIRVWTERSEYYVGETVYIKAEVKNYGDVEGETDIIVKANDVTIDKVRVRLKLDEYKKITFKYAFTKPGNYEICVLAGSSKKCCNVVIIKKEEVTKDEEVWFPTTTIEQYIPWVGLAIAVLLFILILRR